MPLVVGPVQSRPDVEVARPPCRNIYSEHLEAFMSKGLSQQAGGYWERAVVSGCDSTASTECASIPEVENEPTDEPSVHAVDSMASTAASSETKIGKSMSEPWAGAADSGLDKTEAQAPRERTRRIPTKNTFIHFDSERSRMVGRLAKRPQSAPPAVTLREPEAPHYRASEAHIRGRCQPCGYFWYKADGCRNGSSCRFCHACPRGEFARRKKERQARRKAARAAAQEQPPACEAEDSDAADATAASP